MKGEHKKIINTLAQGITEWMTGSQIDTMLIDTAEIITKEGRVTTQEEVERELSRQRAVIDKRQALLPTPQPVLKIRLMRHLLNVGMEAAKLQCAAGAQFRPHAVPYIKAYSAKERRWIVFIARPTPPTPFKDLSYLCGWHQMRYFAVRIPSEIKDIETARNYLAEMKKRKETSVPSFYQIRSPLHLAYSSSGNRRRI